MRMKRVYISMIMATILLAIPLLSTAKTMFMTQGGQNTDNWYFYRSSFKHNNCILEMDGPQIHDSHNVSHALWLVQIRYGDYARFHRNKHALYTLRLSILQPGKSAKKAQRRFTFEINFGKTIRLYGRGFIREETGESWFGAPAHPYAVYVYYLTPSNLRALIKGLGRHAMLYIGNKRPVNSHFKLAYALNNQVRSATRRFLECVR